MKYVFVVIGSIILIGVVVLSLNFNFFKPNKEISNIKYFNYGAVDGMAMYDGVHFNIDYKDGKYIATIQKNGVSEEDAKVVEISKDKVKELEDILNKHEVGKWDGFKKYDKNVLDGHSFSLHLMTFDDITVDASGYMKWPDNYGKVRGELESFFGKL